MRLDCLFNAQFSLLFTFPSAYRSWTNSIAEWRLCASPVKKTTPASPPSPSPLFLVSLSSPLLRSPYRCLHPVQLGHFTVCVLYKLHPSDELLPICVGKRLAGKCFAVDGFEGGWRGDREAKNELYEWVNERVNEWKTFKRSSVVPLVQNSIECTQSEALWHSITTHWTKQKKRLM